MYVYVRCVCLLCGVLFFLALATHCFEGCILTLYTHAELSSRFPDIPVISKNSKMEGYADRVSYQHFFCVNPLDGYKVIGADTGVNC